MDRDLFKQFDQINSQDELVVLTPNRRMSTTLRRQYDALQHKQGKTAWESPNILPLQTWLMNIWHIHHTTQERCLSELELTCAWHNILSADSTLDLINTRQSAKLALQAFEHCQLYGIALAQIENNHRADVNRFVRWAKNFQAQCEDAHWITPAQLPSALIKMLSHQTCPLPQTILFTGFDDLPPLLTQLKKTLREHCTVKNMDPMIDHATVQHITLADQDTEISTMARFAKQHHANHPTHTIACIVPTLSEIRGTVETIFTDTFTPEAHLPGVVTPNPPFNISSGKPLHHIEIIQRALEVLSFYQHSISAEMLHTLLQSPYLCPLEADKNHGAMIDVHLRERCEPEITLDALYDPIYRTQAYYPHSTWLKRLRLCSSTLKNNAEASPREWAQRFTRTLSAIGWPGGRMQNSEEYQVLSRWQTLLEDYANLEIFHPTLTTEQALTLLHALCSDTLFQTKTDDEPIQVLGVLEAAGNTFDVIWMMGLSDDVFPPAAKPNPFLPLELQRQYHMPHADAHRELQFATQILHRLTHSASRVIFSTPAQRADQPLSPSALLQPYEPFNSASLNLPIETSLTECVFKTQNLETFVDQQAPALTDHERSRGGSWILKQQSACPFKAFASIRLQAESPKQPAFGLTPAERGTLVHQSLEKVWLQIKTQARLKQLDDAALKTLVENSIEAVLIKANNAQQLTHSRRLLQLEKKRLTQLTLEWLSLEKTRAPFTVLEQETTRNITVGKLPLIVQIDRIDILSDNTHVIIDYKTGYCSINDWFTDRPKDPQLPLYCVYGKNDEAQPFSGLAFGQCRIEGLKFSGILNESHDKTTLPGAYPLQSLKQTILSWDQLLCEWKKTLETLANDFCEGVAAVDPATVTTCQYCELSPLCRINDKR